RRLCDRTRQVTRATHRAAVVLDDHIALLEAGLGGRRARAHGRHERAVGLGEPEALGEIGGQRLDADAEPAACHVARGGQLADDGLGKVDRDREPDADRAAAAAHDRGVDADRLAARVDQRAAAVARVDGGVGLDEVVVRALAEDRKSTRLNSSHVAISYAVFCLKKKKNPFSRPSVCVHGPWLPTWRAVWTSRPCSEVEKRFGLATDRSRWPVPPNRIPCAITLRR